MPPFTPLVFHVRVWAMSYLEFVLDNSLSGTGVIKGEGNRRWQGILVARKLFWVGGSQTQQQQRLTTYGVECFDFGPARCTDHHYRHQSAAAAAAAVTTVTVVVAAERETHFVPAVF